MTSTQRLYELGGKVGSKLIGTCPFDGAIDVIQVTAIGKEGIIAIKIEKDGKVWEDGHECNWTLELRDWKLIEEKV